MNLIQRFNRATDILFFGERNAVQNQYEAGQRWNPCRSYIPGWVRDSRFDADAMTRLEIVRKSRYFERNNAIVNRLADLFEEYTVGPNGLRFVPASSDQKWNGRQRTFWDGWTPFCDLSTLQNFGTVQSLCARSWAIDGEVFALKTRGKNRGNGKSFPRIQLIETHRVETPPHLFGDTQIVDGVQVNNDSRPLGYHVRQGNGVDETYAYVPADEMVHIFEPTRPGMFRGLPMLYPVLNDLHDLDDLQILQMDVAKEAAKTTAVVKTKTGELSMEDLRRSRWGIAGTQGTSGGSSQERSQYYEDVFEGRVKVLRHGDDYAQHQVVRPSTEEFALWDHLTSKVCAGFGISKLLVYPWSMQGTVTRADLDVMATFFRSRSAILASKFTEIYEYVTEWGTRNDITISDPPPDWRKVKVRAPRSVNVDVGRNVTALVAEYAAGWRTLEGIAGELGEDWIEILQQRAIERSKARELEQEYGLVDGELIGAALEAIKQSNPTQQAPATQETVT